MMHKARTSMDEVPYCFFFNVICQISRSHTKNWRFRQLKFKIADGYEMIHKAWCSIEEVPFCFPRSSVKFQGDSVLKDNLRHVLPNALNIEVLLRGVNIGVHLTHFWVQYCFSLSSHRTKEYTSYLRMALNPTPCIYNDTLAYLKAEYVNDLNKNGQCHGKNSGLINREKYICVSKLNLHWFR